MPKKAKSTAFWERLTLARSTCKPPKSMKQEDIRKDYDAAFQSTVTKWKTGGPAGTTLPKPEQILKMANDTNVSVDWLWRGVGEMRPSRRLDPITEQIVDAVQQLNEDEKLEILKQAAAQPTLRRLQIAQNASKRLRQAAHS